MTSSAARVAAGSVSALWAPATWRATLHALAGLVVVGFTVALLVLWGGAVASLADGPTGAPALTVVYVIAAVIGVVPLVWWLSSLGKVQRARFRGVLGVDIPAPPRAGRFRVNGRQLGYHALALLIGPVGGGLVAACWLTLLTAAVYPGAIPAGRPAAIAVGAVLLLAAPWVARGVARLDERAGRALLGPDPAQELTRRVETLSRSRADVVAAADAERRRIERDLHDGAQQRLVALAMNLGMARATLGEVPDQVRAVIEQSHEEALRALEELRTLVRGLHPAVLTDRGLNAALSGLVARASLPVRLEVDVPSRCDPAIEAIAYFTVSEALANVAKHAGAGRAEVTVRQAGGRLCITVADDGQGGARLDGDGTGLRGLAQRAGAVDGSLRVDSPPGGPTVVTVELPGQAQ